MYFGIKIFIVLILLLIQMTNIKENNGQKYKYYITLYLSFTHTKSHLFIKTVSVAYRHHNTKSSPMLPHSKT